MNKRATDKTCLIDVDQKVIIHWMYVIKYWKIYLFIS